MIEVDLPEGNEDVAEGFCKLIVNKHKFVSNEELLSKTDEI